MSNNLHKVALSCLLAVMVGQAGAVEPLVAVDIAPQSWPYTLTFTNAAAVDQLLVVQEAGIELQLVAAGGEVSHLPDSGRAGPAFSYVPAGQTLQLSIAPYYANQGGGGFRYSAVELDTPAKQAAASAFSAAGLLAGSGHRDSLLAACSRLGAAAELGELPADWHNLSLYLLVSCQTLAAQEASADALAGIAAIEAEFFGIAPYYVDWLRGLYSFSRDDYGQAELLYSKALARLDSTAAPATVAVQLDTAAISSALALAKIVLSYNSSEPATKDSLLATADTLLQDAAAVANTYQDHSLLSEIHDSSSALHYVRGNDAGVFEHLLKAKQEADLLNHPEAAITILGSLGDYYKKWGQQKQALDAYLSQAQIIESGKSMSRGGDVYHNLASLYLTLGDFPRAREMAEKAIAIYLDSNVIYRARIIHYELAMVLEAQGDLPAARERLQEQIDYMATLDTPWEPIRMKAQSLLSGIEARLGNLPRAQQLSDDLFAHEDQLRRMAGHQATPVFIERANLLLAGNQTTAALQLLDTALTTIATQPADRIEVMAAQLGMLQQLARTDEAIALAEQTFALIESQQMQLESVRLGPYWNGKMQDVYARHVEYLLTKTDATGRMSERAFTVAERARAASLRLRRQEMALAATESDPAATAAWQRLLRESEATYGSGNSAAAALARERQLAQARERFFAAHSDSLLLQPPSPLELAAVAPALPTDTAALVFVAGPTTIWRYELAATGWRVVSLGDAALIKSLADGVTDEMSRPNARSQNLETLSGLLLKELAIPAGTQHLLISSAGPLTSVPFAALRYRDGYLMDHGTLTEVPSISEYLAGSSEYGRSHSVELAVLADPQFDTVDAPVAVASTAPLFHSWSSTLERLPATAVEAEALSAFYASDQRLILTGPAATQQQFFSPAVRNARIIHIATHGYFNEQMPELVGFAMSKGHDDDGFVSMAEIAAERFSAELVVISACSTAQGETIAGEGNMSLARTFLAQGVGAVISTLWPISDRATAVFMKEFYRALNEDGASYAEALDSARQVLRATPAYRNPYYWSAYTLSSASSTAI